MAVEYSSEVEENWARRCDVGKVRVQSLSLEHGVDGSFFGVCLCALMCVHSVCRYLLRLLLLDVQCSIFARMFVRVVSTPVHAAIRAW